MDFNVQVFHHFVPDDDSEDALSDINRKLDHIIGRLRIIMTKQEELAAELAEINTTTNELAVDVDDLLARPLVGLSDADAEAHKVKLQELKAALQVIAAKHTPTPVEPPPPPPVEGEGSMRPRR